MESPFIVKREVKRVAIVVFASNTSLCGGFNANIIRHLTVILDEYKSLGMENVLLYPVGRKVAEGVKKLGFKAEGDFQHILLGTKQENLAVCIILMIHIIRGEEAGTRNCFKMLIFHLLLSLHYIQTHTLIGQTDTS